MYSSFIIFKYEKMTTNALDKLHKKFSQTTDLITEKKEAKLLTKVEEDMYRAELFTELNFAWVDNADSILKKMEKIYNVVQNHK